MNVFAILCTLALLSVAFRICWLAVLHRNATEKPREYAFFRTQLGNYAGCLLVAMTFNCGAGILALPWLLRRGISLGEYLIYSRLTVGGADHCAYG